MPAPTPTPVGTPAPAFKLPAADGSTVDSKDLVGRTPFVLYFFPKADTPGCTTEACGFRDAIASYAAAGVPVFGVSPDPVADVRSFSDKFQLNFKLLADADHAVCDRYGVWGDKVRDGVTSVGTHRTTFIVGRDGKIAHVFEKVEPKGHDSEVLRWLSEHPST